MGLKKGDFMSCLSVAHRAAVSVFIFSTMITSGAGAEPQNPAKGSETPSVLTSFFQVGEQSTEELSLPEVSKIEKRLKVKSSGPAMPGAPGVQNPVSSVGGPTSGAGVISAADAKCQDSAAVGKTLSEDLTTEDLNHIISIGKEVWELVKTGKPVVDVQRDEIAVLPLRVECWRHLEGWHNPVVKAYRTRIKNLYGMTVVDFTYKVISYYGGSYRGIGKYLARVSVVPVETSVAPWWEFNAAVRVPGVFNYGTVQDPVASVEIEVSTSVRTVLTHRDQVDNYLIKGNGELLAL